jgi:GGDEF domain-containing protein
MLIENVIELQRLAYTDRLTGCFNMTWFELMGGGDYFIVMDIKGFGKINKDLGHLKGNEKLREFGVVLRENLRSMEGREKDEIEINAVRFGGDEFIVTLKKCDLEGATRVRTRLEEVLSLPVYFGVGRTLEEAFVEVELRKNLK